MDIHSGKGICESCNDQRVPLITVVSDSIDAGVQNLNVPSCRDMRSAVPDDSTGWSAEQRGCEADGANEMRRHPSGKSPKERIAHKLLSTPCN